MRTFVLLLLALVLFVCIVSGIVLNLLIVLVTLSNTVALTSKLLCFLYFSATVIAVGLLYLFVRIGGST